jgi:conjugal transfer pilus assembly protein TraW
MATSMPLLAKDFGQRGQVYPIIETNFLDYIYQRLKTYQDTGKLAEIKVMMQNKVEQTVVRPRGINLMPAVKVRVRNYDPSLMLDKDIKNHEGRLIASKGTVVNPLSYVTLSKQLIFINADRASELEFAKAKIKDTFNNKIILVNGNVKEANQVIGAPVYFDQAARLINRFGLEYTPSVVEQNGNMLKITEVVL